jgi:hypothetical protein
MRLIKYNLRSTDHNHCYRYQTCTRVLKIITRNLRKMWGLKQISLWQGSWWRRFTVNEKLWNRHACFIYKITEVRFQSIFTDVISLNGAKRISVSIDSVTLLNEAWWGDATAFEVLLKTMTLIFAEVSLYFWLFVTKPLDLTFIHSLRNSKRTGVITLK